MTYAAIPLASSFQFNVVILSQDQKGFRYMYHRALKFSRHPSIPSKAIVDEGGIPLSISNKRPINEQGRSLKYSCFGPIGTSVFRLLY